MTFQFLRDWFGLCGSCVESEHLFLRMSSANMKVQSVRKRIPKVWELFPAPFQQESVMLCNSPLGVDAIRIVVHPVHLYKDVTLQEHTSLLLCFDSTLHMDMVMPSVSSRLLSRSVCFCASVRKLFTVCDGVQQDPLLKQSPKCHGPFSCFRDFASKKSASQRSGSLFLRAL